MRDRPWSIGACCPGGDRNLTQLRLSEDGNTVGISGLHDVFEQLLAMERAPEDATDEELVQMVRAQKNYIPPKASVEAVYAIALRREYGIYWKQHKEGS